MNISSISDINSCYKENRGIEDFILIVSILLIASFHILASCAYRKVFFGSFLGILLLLDQKRKVKFGTFIWGKLDGFLFLFSVYVAVSSFWAWDFASAKRVIVSMFSVFGMAVILRNCFSDKNGFNRLLRAIMWAGFLLAFYSCFYYGIGYVWNVVARGGRLYNSFDNINSISILVASAVLIAFYFMVFEQKYYLAPFAVIGLILCIACNSRKVFLMFLLGVPYIFVMSFLNRDKDKNNKVIKITLLLILAFCVCCFLLGWLDGPISRMAKTVHMLSDEGQDVLEADGRYYLIMDGLEQFKKTPVRGIGFGCSYLFSSLNTYTHCNYVEVLACGGVVGFCLFYVMYLYAFIKLMKGFSFHRKKDFITLGTLFLLMVLEIALVTYYEKSLYLYLVMIYIGIQNRTEQKLISC